MNETEAERQRRASEELAQKMRLERPVAIQIRQILRNMSIDLGTVYAATGTVVDAAQYRDDFIGVLRPAYRRATNFFGSQAEMELLQNRDDPSHSLLIGAFAALAARGGRTIEEEITEFQVRKNQRILEFINRSVPIRADEITATNQKALDNAVGKAIAGLTAAGVAFNASDVGREAGNNFRSSNMFRGNMIAATEIQNAAEGAKQIESVALQESVQPIQNQELGRLQTLKEWHTQGDEAVRPAHVAADLQQQPFRQPFEVGGELLRFPGDTSLGASAGNTINCRCSSIQFLDGSLPE